MNTKSIREQKRLECSLNDFSSTDLSFRNSNGAFGAQNSTDESGSEFSTRKSGRLLKPSGKLSSTGADDFQLDQEALELESSLSLSVTVLQPQAQSADCQKESESVSELVFPPVVVSPPHVVHSPLVVAPSSVVACSSVVLASPSVAVVPHVIVDVQVNPASEVIVGDGELEASASALPQQVSSSTLLLLSSQMNVPLSSPPSESPPSSPLLNSEKRKTCSSPNESSPASPAQPIDPKKRRTSSAIIDVSPSEMPSTGVMDMSADNFVALLSSDLDPPSSEVQNNQAVAILSSQSSNKESSASIKPPVELPSSPNVFDPLVSIHRSDLILLLSLVNQIPSKHKQDDAAVKRIAKLVPHLPANLRHMIPPASLASLIYADPLLSVILKTPNLVISEEDISEVPEAGQQEFRLHNFPNAVNGSTIPNSVDLTQATTSLVLAKSKEAGGCMSLADKFEKDGLVVLTTPGAGRCPVSSIVLAAYGYTSLLLERIARLAAIVKATATGWDKLSKYGAFFESEGHFQSWAANFESVYTVGETWEVYLVGDALDLNVAIFDPAFAQDGPAQHADNQRELQLPNSANRPLVRVMHRSSAMCLTGHYSAVAKYDDKKQVVFPVKDASWFKTDLPQIVLAQFGNDLSTTLRARKFLEQVGQLDDQKFRQAVSEAASFDSETSIEALMSLLKNARHKSAVTEFWSSIGRSQSQESQRIVPMMRISEPTDPISSLLPDLHVLRAGLRASGVDIDSITRSPNKANKPSYASVVKPVHPVQPVQSSQSVPSPQLARSVQNTSRSSHSHTHMGIPNYAHAQRQPFVRGRISPALCNNKENCPFLANGRCWYQHPNLVSVNPSYNNRSYLPQRAPDSRPYCLQHNYRKGGCSYINCKFRHEREPEAAWLARQSSRSQNKRL